MIDDESTVGDVKPTESPSFSEEGTARAGSSRVTVRAAGPADAADLSRVASATFALACPPSTTQASIDDFIATHFTETHFAGYLADPERALFLAVADADGESNPIGYTMVIFGEPTDTDVIAAIALHPTAELSKVYVLAGHHGAGVAARLVEASVAAAAERGAVGIWLGVNQLNARANRFYEKSGFARVGVKRFRLGDTYEEDFVRERAIDADTIR
ncbi:MAG: diamine N-acetyltransferase [Actinomycetota bacterium]|jgi:ribosomal protein S18 acetylase RimI-like enzyme|nr:diamine N-acetyltransferase [Actinomycetota bacterium]MDQ1573702.1 diamine N-acetyltransferase [Actinomycetota bacterium]